MLIARIALPALLAPYRAKHGTASDSPAPNDSDIANLGTNCAWVGAYV
jgi:hypothetical protein